MQKFKIGIVGNGFVGSAICKGLNHYHDVKIYDVNSAKSTHSFDETITQDIVFVCLPTPMFKDTLGSDTSYIIDFFNILSSFNFKFIFFTFINVRFFSNFTTINASIGRCRAHIY